MVDSVGRVFAAVPLAPDARLSLSAQLESLEIPGKVAPPGNWHVTIRFLGTIDEPTYDRFLAELATSDLPRPFPVRLSGIGGFPNRRKATVVWVGVVAGGSHLARINDLAEEACLSAGLGEEDRPFHPHVTLARVRPPRSIEHLDGAVVELSFSADRLVVYRSHLGRGAARYEALEEFSLST